MNENIDRIEEKNVTVEVGSTVLESSVQTQEKIRIEEFKISGDALVTKVKALLRQSNIRSIVIKNSSGRTLIDIPLSIGLVGGVVGTVVFPVAALLSAIAVLAANMTIVIARKE